MMPSVEAELDTVDAILGMDFLKVYDVTINLRHDIVSLGAGALIHQVIEEKSVDRVPVIDQTSKSMPRTGR